MRKLSDADLAFRCEVRWEDMAEREEGRYCGHCAKIVYDLRDCSLEDAKKLQKKHGGKICGLVLALGLGLSSCSTPLTGLIVIEDPYKVPLEAEDKAENQAKPD